MKKIYSFLALLLMAVGMQAQSWEIQPDGEYPYSTVVYARLQTNLTSSNLIIGAFIDGYCKTAVAAEPDEYTGQPLYTLNVKSDLDGDLNKDIYFKLYDGETGFEYSLTSPIEMKFTDLGTYGNPPSTSAVVFTLTAPTSYSLSFTEAEAGKEYNLMDSLTITPAGATLPENLTWEITPEGYAWATDTVLLAGNTPYEGLTLTLSGPMLPTGGPGVAVASSVFNIVQHATAINLLKTTIKVKKDDISEISAFMNVGTAYTLEPVTTTDQVVWETDNTSILQWSERGYFVPKQTGTAKMRPYILKADGSKLVPADDAWITVTVYVPVTSIELDLNKYNGNFIANVGDTHIYERIANIVTILPADATDKTFKITIDDPDALKLIGETTINAVKSGMDNVRVVANGGEDPESPVSTGLGITVVAPTTGATPRTNPVTIGLTDGNAEDITEQIQNNINYSNATGEPITEVNGTVTLSGAAVTCTDESGAPAAPGLSVNGITGQFTAVAEGTSTITVTLSWPDYDSWGIEGGSATLQYATAVFSFDIKVTNSLTLDHFDITISNAVAGATGTITLTPQPANATYDYNAITVALNNGLSEAWAATLSSNLKSAAANEIVYEFTSTVPCKNVYITVTDDGNIVSLNDPSTGAGIRSFEIGYALDLNAGWQWASIPCGAVAPGQLEAVFSATDLEEIRTSTQLLYNDPNWGFFGTLAKGDGIKQGQLFKVKMHNTHTSVLLASEVGEEQIFGTPNETDGSLSITLKPGWNWVGYPYLFSRRIENVLKNSDGSLEGLVIVGKLGSTTGTNTGWQGDLKMLEAGQGYVFKNPNETNIILTFPAETTLTAANDEKPAGVKSFAARANVWQYDHSRFMNNMTMVAKIEDLDNAEQYSIGAFVGDECRGEGIIENDKAFITVHCDMGEQVTFKLYNAFTGEFRLIEESLKAQTRVGSLKAPFKFHAGALTDGINGIAKGGAHSTETYDLSGRRTSTQQRGISVRRMADGSLRKVINK